MYRRSCASWTFSNADRKGTKQCVIVTRNEEVEGEINFFLPGDVFSNLHSYPCFPVSRQPLSTFRRLETPKTTRSFVLAVDQLVGRTDLPGGCGKTRGNIFPRPSSQSKAGQTTTTASEMKAWFNGFPMATGFVRSGFRTIFHASVVDVGTWNRRWMANTTPTGMPKEVIS